MPKTVAVIDGNSLMHRAYHAVPPTMTAPDGTPTNAAFGFLSMLLKFIEMEQPDALVCAFDKGRPKFRMEALEQYKAQRPPMDEELKAQFPVIENLLAAMNVPVVALPGWEGDDILGTVAARDEELGYRTLLVTGDKDAYQLASDLTHIVTTKRGITDVVIYGPAEVEERYGVTPAQFTDFLGLKGDKADNIPGVPGIGDKKAASMLQAYGNLEGIYANLDKFKGKQLENLTNYKDDAFLSRQVATIVRDADFELDLESISFPDFDAEEVTKAFTEVRMMAHLAKVLKLQGGEAATADLGTWDTLLEGADAKAALEEHTEGYLPVSWALDSQASLFGEGLSLAVNLGDSTALFHDAEAKEALAFLIRERDIAAADAKALLQVVFPADTAKEALVSRGEVLDARIFDVTLAAYVADSNNGAAGLGALMERYAGAMLPEEKDPQKALALEAAAIGALVEPLTKELEKEEARKVYDAIDLPLVGVLACMERTGAALDVEHLKALNESTGAEVERLRAAIYQSAGREFNVDSPKQLSEVLFDELGLTPKKKTRSGYSTNAAVLKELADEHELPGLMLEYREYAKIKSTYIDALPRMRADDGRVHTSFNEMVTTTGRLSSSDPNLQNIPVRTDFGRQIRTCFVPLNEGEVFVSADYSQIELRLLAHLSGDDHLIDSFNSGEDFHASTASRVFGVPMCDVTPQMRSRAKAVNFGIVYGQQAYGLSQSLHIPFYEAKEMIDRYFEVHPGVRSYLDGVVEQAHKDGYATTLFGRRRYIPELNAKNAAQRGFGERTAMNHPMQGTAADIIKLAMRQVQDELVARDLGARLLLQVHDELDLSVPKVEVAEVSELLTSVMESVGDLSVPLLVDVSAGANWAEAH
ncbi:MAG: DNA polymerase I [Eggerthellaceae bacterium]|nr:DNA polymerase I [Eggerthellaceae bacterium]